VRRLRPAVVLAGWLAIAALVSPAGAAADPDRGGAVPPETTRPAADPWLPTPTAPHPGLPPQGTAPDGSTVGGDELGTRGVVVAEGAPPLPRTVVASGWLVADADTGDVLAARDPHGRYYPASTLKLLTLLTLAPRLDPDLVVPGTVEDEAVEGSRVGLVQGGRYRVRLLLRALVMQSGNDAANALARAAGGTTATLAAMTRQAEELGAFDTVVGTPSGLDVAGQSSSPYDLALVMRAVLAEPAAAAPLLVRTARMPGVPGRSPGYEIQNENPLIDSPGNLGGKTGFTDAARHTFVTAAERGGRRLVVTVMRTGPQPQRTGPQPLRAAEQAALLLEWGFAVPPGTEGVGRLVEPGEVPAEPPPAPAPRTSAPAAVVATVAPPAGGGSLLVPAALGAAAMAVLAATAFGVRRALRRGSGPPAGTPSTRS
jgi:D-alanyl-D-alanine carboxypeptidase